MELELEVTGIEEVQALLGRYSRLATSDELWIPTTTAAGEELRRYAASISPVVTGSYRDAHTVISRGKQAIMTIDPGAMNRGVPVTDYAGAIEDRHRVYERTFAAAGERGAIAGARVILERMG